MELGINSECSKDQLRRAAGRWAAQPLEIIDESFKRHEGDTVREGAFTLPIDVLEQKLLMQQGLVMVT